MEIDIEGEGGWTELATGENSHTKLEVFPAEPEQIRISLTARASHGEMGLGVGLTPEQARSVGEWLIGLSREIENDRKER